MSKERTLRINELQKEITRLRAEEVNEQERLLKRPGVIVPAAPPPKGRRGRKPVVQETLEEFKGLLISVVMGEYGTKVGAEQEALDFRHPEIFFNRSALFPQPRDFRVKAKIFDVSVVPNTSRVSTLYPFRLAFKIAVEGEAEQAKEWARAFCNRARDAEVSTL